MDGPFEGCGLQLYLYSEAIIFPVGGDPCFLPVDPGPCRGSFQKYYYNTGSGSCDPFIYGGCKGNSNNFMTMQECEAECRKPGMMLEYYMIGYKMFTPGGC